MKKSTIVVISTLAIAVFVGALYYGLQHARGKPTAFEMPGKVIVEAPFLEKEVDLQKLWDASDWAGLQATRLDMIYQVTVLPWPRKLVPTVEVKAFHNKKDIYFYMQWNDDTEDRSRGPAKFPDACAIMFPLDKDAKPSTLMMGFLGKSNIWQWKADRDNQYWSGKMVDSGAYVDFHYPFEDEETLAVARDEVTSAVRDLAAVRVGTITPKESQVVQGRGAWTNGVWRVVFKRAIATADSELDADFLPGLSRLCAFAVWNGAHGDRGGRKSISNLIHLELN